MTRESYQAELRRVWGHPKLVTSRSGIADGAQLDAVPIPPSPDPSKYLLGVLLVGSVKVSNTGTNTFIITTANGGDALDFFFQRVRIKADEGSIVRSSAQKRSHVEAFEQITLNANKRSYPYPAKSVATTANGVPSTNKITPSHTSFVNVSEFVPVGGKSCAVEIDVPALPTIGNGATNADISAKGIIATASRIINYKAIYGHDSTIVSFDGRTTQSLAVNADNSLLEYQTKSMSPDFVGYLNKTQVTQILMETDSEVLVNSKSGDFTWIQNTTPDMAPTYAVAATAYGNSQDLLWWTTNKKRLATHIATIQNTNITVTLDLLSLSFDDGPKTTALGAPETSPTPDIPASSIAPKSTGANTKQGAQIVGHRNV